MMRSPIPFLWFEKEAEEAVNFYVSLLPESRIERVTTLPADTPSGPAGSVKVVEFTLAGQSWQAMNAGRLDPFNHAVSFMIECADQQEIDRLWDALLKSGGKEQQCGWIRDRWGLCWQIVPANIVALTRSDNREGAKRATQAMLKMVKLDKAALEKAFDDG
jgi:predicted 3-demethylubiquinone-9 3-methyltransferase (glyoxalase superfamily)